jgi:hypothetical protein
VLTYCTLLQRCGAGVARTRIILVDPEPEPHRVKAPAPTAPAPKVIFSMDSFQKIAQTE